MSRFGYEAGDRQGCFANYIRGKIMSHTDIEHHHGYSLHASSDKHDTGKWVGSFHIARQNYPVISISDVHASFDSSEEAAAYALQQGRLYIENELAAARL
jgi:hypothetical protein